MMNAKGEPETGGVRGDASPASAQEIVLVTRPLSPGRALLAADDEELSVVMRPTKPRISALITAPPSKARCCRCRGCLSYLFMMLDLLARFFYHILAAVGNLLLFLIKIVVGLLTLLSLVFCCCFIHTKANPFQEGPRLTQAERIDRSLNNSYVICFSLVDTLVHLSKQRPTHRHFSSIRYRRADGKLCKLYVSERPNLREFLQLLAMHFRLAIFSNLSFDLTLRVLQRVDRDFLVGKVLSHDDMVLADGKYVRDLRKVDPDVSRVIMVDVGPEFLLQKENLLQIRPFAPGAPDAEFRQLARTLHSIFADQRRVFDVRDVTRAFEPSEQISLLN